MTISHFESRAAAEAARDALAPVWTPVTFSCAEAVHVMRREGGGGQFERCFTLPLGAGASTPPRTFEPPLRFASMPLEEEEWVRQARKAAMVQNGRRGGRGRSGRRRPRRSSEERKRIAQRTPEEIAEIRAARAAKKAAAEAAAAAGGLGREEV